MYSFSFDGVFRTHAIQDRRGDQLHLVLVFGYLNVLRLCQLSPIVYYCKGEHFLDVR